MAEVQHREPHEVFAAACRLAADPKVRTPKVLAFEGAHWRIGTRAGDEPDAKPALTPSTRCGTCYRSREGHDHANSLVDATAQHAWVTEADERANRKRADRPDQTRNLDRTPLPDRDV